MVAPVWTTTAGKIASIDEQVSFSVQLEANTSDSTTIVYSLIAGSLPSGMQLTSTGLLTGTPAEVAKRTRYTFIIRATAGTQITDRNFYLDVEGADAPVFTTAAGQLNKPLSTVYTTDDTTATADNDVATADITGNVTVLDGSYIEYQIVATDTDTSAGQSLLYEVVQGSLPPGVTMTSKGKISGVVELTEDTNAAPRGGYDNEFEHYDDVVYDKTVRTTSKSVNYDFIVRVTDGVSTVDRNFSVFVYSADYWVVSNTQITIDQTLIGSSHVTMDLHVGRPPVFTTDSDLGTFRHDNQVVIRIDVSDFDPLQADLEYSITSGSLPPGTTMDINTGEISGQLARQAAVEKDYSFTVRANRVVATGINTFSERVFTMKVIGEIGIGIVFNSPTTLGTLSTNQPSLLSISATAENENRVLSYSIKSGSLPPGITLSQQGNLVGTIDKDSFNDSTTAFSFTVTVSDQYQSSAAEKEFTVNVDIPFTTIEYGNLHGHSTSLIDQNIFYNIAQDGNINSEENIFRPEDPEFGIKIKPDVLLLSGLQAQTLTTFQQQMEQNHSNKKLFFGDIKTAVAKENNITKYEVVYIEMKDTLVNNDGDSIASSINLRSDIARPVIGPRASTTKATTDMNVYEITTDGGLSFSASGSLVRFANEMTADLDTVSVLFPNAVANMRARMKSLGQKEYTNLPLWMRTPQTDTGAPLGFTLAVPIAYCLPGKSGLVKKRIEDKKLQFKNIDYEIDRYTVSTKAIATKTFTGDGSTTTFVLDEIVHEEDILVKEGTNTVIVGEGVTASGFRGFFTFKADSNVRTADHEIGAELSHDTSTKKTTLTFLKEVPSAGTIITVDRAHDKYLKFKNKGI